MYAILRNVQGSHKYIQYFDDDDESRFLDEGQHIKIKLDDGTHRIMIIDEILELTSDSKLIAKSYSSKNKIILIMKIVEGMIQKHEYIKGADIDMLYNVVSSIDAESEARRSAIIQYVKMINEEEEE